MIDFVFFDDEHWDEIISQFEHADIYYTRNYVAAFKINGDGNPILIHYTSSQNEAIEVVMLRDIAKSREFEGIIDENTFFDISTPYGYGGLVFKYEPNHDELITYFDQLNEYCKNKSIVSGFIRFHPVNDNVRYCRDIYQTVDLGDTITMRLESPEYIWTSMSSKNRNMVRKAQKNDIKIYYGRDKKLFEEFKTMYEMTMDRDNASDYYYFSDDFYDSILEDMKYNAMIFYAVLEGKIIAMSIIMYKNNQLHYHLSASDAEYRNMAPSNLLLYEVACWGAENGYKTLHLGGGVGGNKEDGLYKFKKSFYKGENTRFSIGKIIFDEKKYTRLCSIRFSEGNYDDVKFFPQYRG